MKKTKIVMCGCHESGWYTVQYLLEQGIHFDYFVTLSEEKARKLQVSGFKSFEDLAQKYHIPIYYVDKYSLKSKQDLAFFEEQQFDLLVQGGWQRLFPDEVLKSLKCGAIGGHGSADFLPQGRGRSPINWSLIEGRQRFIMHYFLIKPGIDDGDVFYYEIFDINPWDNCQTLYYKVSLTTRRVLKEWIPKLLQNQYSTWKQNGQASFYPKRTPEDGLIDWNQSVFDIYNLIRGITHPYPGAFTYLEGKEKVYLWQAQPFDTRLSLPFSQQGEVIAIFDSHLVIHCNEGLLLVTHYEHSGNLPIQDGSLFKNAFEENPLAVE